MKQKIVAWVSTSIRVSEPEVKAALERLAVAVDSVTVGSPIKVLPGDDTMTAEPAPAEIQSVPHTFVPDPDMDDELCRECMQPADHENHS